MNVHFEGMEDMDITPVAETEDAGLLWILLDL
jgi:hypothetical protein